MRMVRRLPHEQKWDREQVVGLVAIPRRPETRPRSVTEEPDERRDKQLAQDTDTLKQQGGESIPPPVVAPSGLTEKRDFRITTEILKEFGETPGCPGCITFDSPKSQRTLHTQECRLRLEAQMRGHPKYARRIEERDKRHRMDHEPAKGADRYHPEDDQEQHHQAREAPEASGSGVGRASYSPTSPAGSVQDPEEAEDRGFARWIDLTGEDDEPDGPRKSRKVRRDSADLAADVANPDSSDESSPEEEIERNKRRRIEAIGRQGCGRQEAMRILDDLDKKLVRRIPRFNPATRNASGRKPSKKRGGRDIGEAYSPPRLIALASEYGLEPLWAMDLTTHDEATGEPWDFNAPRIRERALQKISGDKPGLVMLGPTRAPFCSLKFGWNYERMGWQDVYDRLESGVRHLAFAVTIA